MKEMFNRPFRSLSKDDKESSSPRPLRAISCGSNLPFSSREPPSIERTHCFIKKYLGLTIASTGSRFFIVISSLEYISVSILRISFSIFPAIDRDTSSPSPIRLKELFSDNKSVPSILFKSIPGMVIPTPVRSNLPSDGGRLTVKLEEMYCPCICL